jgi:sulfur carrier protein ThiS
MMKVEFEDEVLDLEGGISVRELLISLDVDSDRYIVLKDRKMADLDSFLDDGSEVLIIKAIVGG